MNKITTRECTSPRMVSLGPHPGVRPGVGAHRWAPVAGAFGHGTRLGAAQASYVGPPSSRLTTSRRVQKGPVQCDLGVSPGRGPRKPNSRMMTLAIGTWNVTSLGGKEPELVQEVERYRLEIFGLTTTHSLGSGSQLMRDAGLSSILELPMVRGSELVWACL